MVGRSTKRLIIGGALSGCAWFLVAMSFDKGVQDYNWPVIPASSVPAVAASLLGAIVTGVSVAFLFRRAWTSRSRFVLCGTPCLALAAGITIFSVTTWLAWLFMREPPGYSPVGQLCTILGFFLFYGLVSLFAPFLYALAFLNQMVMRKLVQRAAPPAVGPAGTARD